MKTRPKQIKQHCKNDANNIDEEFKIVYILRSNSLLIWCLICLIDSYDVPDQINQPFNSFMVYARHLSSPQDDYFYGIHSV